jgi:4-amino-4-deoxy-L-arabinose transferase-like glycosyltransferase
MVRDWLLSGRWSAPFHFAHDYYLHYPFFGVGYWPPAFSAVTAFVFLAIGVGRQQALLVPAACAATTAWLVFRFLRRRTGGVAAVCAGALYLSLPEVQRWMCAVMADHMTACLCIATSVALLRYFGQPSCRNGIYWTVSCACAILSKYSAAYTMALPWGLILMFRRGAVLRKLSFLIQPLLLALMVGPWVLWTKELAYYGLPTERPPLTVSRAASFFVATFDVFPPVLMVVVIVGLLALLVSPSSWRDDVGVLCLLCAAHLSFLFLSPVGPEGRYLLAPAASLLVLSFGGWAAVLSRKPGHRRYDSAVCASIAALTAVFVVVHFGSYRRVVEPLPIRPIVAAVLKNKAWADQRLVMPPNLEGPFIAEFVAQERRRPCGYLLRPDKLLAHENWFGENYSLMFHTPEQLLDHFRQNPVKLIIWHESPEGPRTAHERILGDMLRQNPLEWRDVGVLNAGDGATSWAIYEQVSLRELR